MIHHLLLDLEDTIIAPVVNGWPQTELVNVRKIKELVHVLKPDFVSIFSFALHTEHDRRGFDLWTRNMVEAVVGQRLAIVPTIPEIIAACCRANPGHLHPDRVTFQELSDFWGKGGAFRLFVRDRFHTNPHDREFVECTLIDDAVWEETTSWNKLNLRASTINIDDYNPTVYTYADT